MDGDGCDKNCKIEVNVAAAICGNGKVESPEVCDDGNTADGDTCSCDCKTKTDPEPKDVTVGDVTVEGDGTVEGDLNIKGDENVDGNLNIDGGMGVAGDLRLDGDIVVTGKDYVLHRFGVMANYGTSIGSPYSVQLRIRYDPMWPVGTSTLLGFAVEAGAGVWNWYRTGAPSVMLPVTALFQVGNRRGGFAGGVECWALAPLKGHKSDEHWELLDFVRVGGYVTFPDQNKDGSALLLEFWAGIPFYTPENPSSPHFKDPMLVVGASIGWVYTWEIGRAHV